MKRKFSPSGYIALLISFLLAAGIIQKSTGDQPATGQTNQTSSGMTMEAGAFFPVTIPFRYWHGALLADVLINANSLSQIVFDTGLSENAVVPEEAERLKIFAGPVSSHISVLDVNVDAKQGKIDRLNLGRVKIDNIPVALVDVPGLLTQGPHPDAPAVWLGTTFLSAFQVTFDFVGHIVILDKSSNPFEKGSGSVVPFKLRNGRIYVKVTIQGAKPFEAALDTGSIGTLIPGEVLRKLNLKPLDVLPVTRFDGKTGKIARVVLPKLSIGKATLTGLHALYYPKEAPVGTDRSLAIIGLDVLRRYKVTINYARQELLLAPPLVIPSSNAEDNANF